MEAYIGRIRLSKNDSKEWSGNPPFMYVMKDGCGCPDRANIRAAAVFFSKDECAKAVRENFKHYRHLPDSKMEVVTIDIKKTNVEII